MKIRTLLCALSICFMTLVQTGCDGPADNKSVGNTEVVSPVDYQNGVFYFGACAQKFGNSLSNFIAKHPELELVSIAPDDSAGGGYTVGYFAVFRNKGKK